MENIQNKVGREDIREHLAEEGVDIDLVGMVMKELEPLFVAIESGDLLVPADKVPAEECLAVLNDVLMSPVERVEVLSLSALPEGDTDRIFGTEGFALEEIDWFDLILSEHLDQPMAHALGNIPSNREDVGRFVNLAGMSTSETIRKYFDLALKGSEASIVLLTPMIRLLPKVAFMGRKHNDLLTYYLLGR